MFFSRLYNLLTGCVTFLAKGGFGERFLNLCGIAGIPIWDIVKEEQGIRCKTTLPGYRAIRPCAKKSGMRLQILQKSGLPFFLFRHRHRWGLAAGAVSLLLCLALLSGQIWGIRFTGDFSPSVQESMLAALSQNGLSMGCRRSKLDGKQVAAATLSQLPNYQWISVNLSGAVAQIELHKSTKALPTRQDGAPSDLVAAYDGQIIYFEPYEGAKIAEPRQVVTKGDLLLGGTVIHEDLTTTQLQANGYIVARTAHEIETQAAPPDPLAYGTLRIHYTLHIFKFHIPLGKKKTTAQTTTVKTEYRLKANGILLPFGYTAEEQWVWQRNNAPAPSIYSRQIFLENFCHELRYKQTIKQTVTLQGNACRGQVTCYENIGQRAPLGYGVTNSSPA